MGTISRDPERAFENLLRDDQASLWRLARAIVRSDHDAEDLLQAALVDVYLHLDRVRELDSLPAFARRTLVRLSISRSRRLWKREMPVGELPESAGQDMADVLTDRLLVSSALRSLPPRQRTAVALRYLGDLPEREIAEAMGCSAGSVKSHLNRGMKKLRTVLEASDAPQKSKEIEPI